MNDVKLSKNISYALRHAPEKFGLTLDEAGWVTTDDLIIALKGWSKRWHAVTVSDIERVMATASKQRFQMQDGRIRATYGHSLTEKIVKQSTIPPEVLYHGTPPQVAQIILVDGLKPMNRQYVHLSAETDTATLVGQRRSEQPAILIVAALAAHEAGIAFYPEENNIWLSDPIPPKFITLKENQ